MADVPTIRNSYFFPFNLNFILSLSRVNSIGELAGMIACSEGFGCRTSYSVVAVRTRYCWQTMAVEDFFPLFFDPQSTDFSETIVPGIGASPAKQTEPQKIVAASVKALILIRLLLPFLNLFEAAFEILANG
jgi:hypothetical protein